VAAPVTAPHGAAPAAKGLGRFKPYPAYKDSDVEWLGPIPAHWEIVRLKRVCTLAYGEALPGEARGDGDIEVYGSNGPVGTHGQANTLAPSLVIGRKGSFGKVNFSYSPVFAIDTTFFVDRRFTKADIRWLYYVLSDARLDRATKDSAVPGLDREDAYAREVCLCPSSEQRAIAAFLDPETAKIDALVEKKERLITLLQEKRTALISHAVTKGLDPTVPMKDSGIEWLGAIPAHWEVKRLKHVAHIASGFAPPESFDRHLGQYPVYGSNGLMGYCDEYFVTRETLAVGRVGASGSVNVVPAKCWVSDNALLLRDLASSTQFCWLRYVLEAMNLGGLAAKNAQPIITGTFLGNQAFAMASVPEQRAIAAFLDRETAKIDALVEKKERLIALLQEKRTALISHAVTKGLAPSVPMKDSGVEWLGPIPAHWEVKRLRFLFRIVNGSTPATGTPGYWDGDIPWVTPDDLGELSKPFIESTRRSITEAGYKSCGVTLVPPGSLVLSTRAPIGHLGIAAVELCTNQGCRGLVLRCEASEKFFFYHLLSAKPELEARGQGSTFRELSTENLASVSVAFPPVPEQRAIAAFLDRETAKIDALIAKVREAIERLKEYRTALISAAVTGKIDVRELGSENLQEVRP
jgi:type I restriction enzyme S subunit